MTPFARVSSARSATMDAEQPLRAISHGASSRFTAALAALAMLAGCQVVPQDGSRPAPAPTPVPAATVAPSPILSWDVAPVAQGNWRYGASPTESVATFTLPTGSAVTFRCLKPVKQVTITLPGYGGSGLAIIRTSAGLLDWSGVTQATTDGVGALLITRPATDPGLDSIAYSRGRISIEPVGARRIILPVVSEIGHVVEDCRN